MSTDVPKDARRLFRRFEPLHERIERNKRRVVWFLVTYVALSSLFVAVALLAGVCLTLLFFAIRLRDEYLLRLLGMLTAHAPVILSCVWAACLPAFIAWAIGALRDGEIRLIASLNALPVPTGDYPHVKSALHDVTIASGLPLPRLMVIDDDAMNAFVVTHGTTSGWIGFTSGLAEQLSKDELRFVFAHLVGRIQDGSATTASILAELFLSASNTARTGDRLADACGEDADDSIVSSIWKTVVSPLALWYLITRGCLEFTKIFVAGGYQKQQELNAEYADSLGLMLTKDPSGMMSTLKKVLPADNRPGSACEPRFRDDIFGALFFAWPAYSFSDDPELVRIERMREVLGAAGI